MAGSLAGRRATSWAVLVGRLVERELYVYGRLWKASVIWLIVQPALMLAAMGIGLGGLIDRGAGSGRLGGLDYLEFIAPGLLAAWTVMGGVGDSLWPVLGGVKWQGHYRSMVTTELRAWHVYAAQVAWVAVRSVISSTAFLVVAAALGAVPSWWGVLTPLVAGIVGATCAAITSIWSIGRDSDLSFAVIMRLGAIPLFLFSGTFFPASQLPAGVRPLVWLSPLWHAVEVCRSLTTGSPGWSDLGHLALLVAAIAVAAPFGARAFERRLTA
jgi:lipooligosaccharide transport system permease protein